VNFLNTTLVPYELIHDSVETIHTSVKLADQNLLRITFHMKGDIDRLSIPDRCPARRADRLWQHTCFEVFIRADGDPVYYEFNFSPSGEWAAYSFRGYRDGGPLDDEGLSPQIVVRRDADQIELDAIVRLDRLSALQPGSTLRIGLSAIIETNDGTLSYWALTHPAAKPDFHHSDSFALELALPEESA
jgi:hypothetical protein